MKFNFDDFEGPADDRLSSWLRPSGSTVFDGVRLAAINVAFLIVLLLSVSLIALILRAIGVPGWVSSVTLVLLAIGGLAIFGAIVWTRYAESHHRLVQSRGRESRGDIFGAIAALPFVGLAFLLLASGVLSLFFSILTFDGGRTLDSLMRVLYGLLFGAAAAGTLIATRNMLDKGRRV
jgi:hypothetical protein